MKDSVDQIIAQWATARPEVDVTPMGVIGRLSRLSRHFERELQEVFSRHGLQPGEFDLLATLRRSDTDGHGLTAGRLAESAMVTSGAITNRLDRLVAKGLVTRETHPHSRRAIRVALTPQGKQVVDEALVDHVAREQRMLADLSPRQRVQLEQLLRALLHEQESRSGDTRR